MLITLLVLLAIASVLLWTFFQDGNKSTTEVALTDDFDEV